MKLLSQHTYALTLCELKFKYASLLRIQTLYAGDPVPIDQKIIDFLAYFHMSININIKTF